jgi:hypothetical protein
MKINSYKFAVESKSESLWIDQTKLDSINLFGGLSGVGKTRLLNTIHNLSLIIQTLRKLSLGSWEIDFSIDKKNYKYTLDLRKDANSGNVFINKEILIKNERKLIERNGSVFIFKDNELPKLSREDIGIFILREEPDIENVFSEFKKIYIRRFNPDYYYKDPKEQIAGFSKEILTLEKEKFTLDYINNNFRDFNSQLFLLKKFHNDVFLEIESDFKEIFPFVEKIDVKPINEIKNVFISGLPIDTFIPILLIKEKKVKELIPVFRISSGMMRAVIQLVDVYTMPENSIYLIDEIENSMGIRSLPVMIDILFKFSEKIQFIFTTHHAYIFNNVDVKYWKILTRDGSHIKVIDGRVLKEKYSKSHQEAYIQLLNSDMIENGI